MLRQNPCLAIYHSPHAPVGPYRPATEKTETTRITTMEVFSFRWKGKECVLTNMVNAVESNKVFQLKQEWEERK